MYNYFLSRDRCLEPMSHTRSEVILIRNNVIRELYLDEHFSMLELCYLFQLGLKRIKEILETVDGSIENREIGSLTESRIQELDIYFRQILAVELKNKYSLNHADIIFIRYKVVNKDLVDKFGRHLYYVDIFEPADQYSDEDRVITMEITDEDILGEMLNNCRLEKYGLIKTNHALIEENAIYAHNLMEAKDLIKELEQQLREANDRLSKSGDTVTEVDTQASVIVAPSQNISIFRPREEDFDEIDDDFFEEDDEMPALVATNTIIEPYCMEFAKVYTVSEENIMKQAYIDNGNILSMKLVEEVEKRIGKRIKKTTFREILIRNKVYVFGHKTKKRPVQC